MKRFLVFAIIILGILFLVFALVFFFQDKPLSKDIIENIKNEENKDTISPILAFSLNTPLNHSWQRDSIIINVQETDFGGPNDKGVGSAEDLLECRYIINGIERSRTCNKDILITIGSDPANDCSVQGTNDPTEGLQYTCALNAYDIDYAKNETNFASRPARLYGIDWTAPLVSQVYGKKTDDSLDIVMGELFEYYALVQEKESSILDCRFFVKEEHDLKYENKGEMEFLRPCQRECEASFSYQFDEPGEYAIRAICQDAAGNYGAGQEYFVSLNINHNPLIRSCRVNPTSGNRDTVFTFEVNAEDSDNDILFYEWEFGDGSKLNGVSTYQYTEKGTYMPRVHVFDEKGGEAFCSTAWVVVEEL